MTVRMASTLSVVQGIARAEAKRLGHSKVTADHFIYALMLEEDNEPYRLFTHFGIIDELAPVIEQSLSDLSDPKSTRVWILYDEMRRAAAEETVRRQQRFVSEEHCIYVLLASQRENVLFDTLVKRGSLEEAQALLERMFNAMIQRPPTEPLAIDPAHP